MQLGEGKESRGRWGGGLTWRGWEGPRRRGGGRWCQPRKKGGREGPRRAEEQLGKWSPAATAPLPPQATTASSCCGHSPDALCRRCTWHYRVGAQPPAPSVRRGRGRGSRQLREGGRRGGRGWHRPDTKKPDLQQALSPMQL